MNINRAIFTERYIGIPANEIWTDEELVKIEFFQISRHGSRNEEQQLEIAGDKVDESTGHKLFHALFTQEEADFKIKVTNDSNKKICLGFKIHSNLDELPLILGPGDILWLTTLDDNENERGYQTTLHFSSQARPTGRLYTMNNAAMVVDAPLAQASMEVSRIWVTFCREAPPPLPISIFIVNSSREPICDVQIDDTDIVHDLKEKIEERIGIQVGEQILTYQGRQLDRDDGLKDVGLRDGSVVELFQGEVHHEALPRMEQDSIVTRGAIIGMERTEARWNKAQFNEDMDFRVEPFIIEMCMHPDLMQSIN